jgi:hypothetical protein
MPKKEVKAPVDETAVLVSGEQTPEGNGVDLFDLGFNIAAEYAIAFAEQLAPGRNGGKRMREHFDALRASKEG